MSSLILSIVSSSMGLLMYFFGNAFIAKWVAAARFWLRQRTEREFLLMVDEEYRQLLSDWESIKKDRE